MGYCALLIPQTVQSSKENKQGFIESLTGKLTSGLKSGGLNFTNATTLLKNTASLVSEGVDTVANKFSGIALTQLLVDGKISNETALNYLKQGFPKALGQTSIALGFQSIDQLENALKSKNGVNVQQFISSFQNFGSALSEFTKLKSIRQEVEGYEVIEIDAVLSDNRSYQSETPDRRVEKGQTYQEYIHNMPDIFTLECIIQDGRNYTCNDFEDILLNLRNRKIAFDVVLGETTKKNVVLTNFSPMREGKGGFTYSLEFKKIDVGSVQLVSLNISQKVKSITNTVKNELNPNDTKTIGEKVVGFMNVRAEIVEENALEILGRGTKK
jgi:hypothetical protein